MRLILIIVKVVFLFCYSPTLIAQSVQKRSLKLEYNSPADAKVWEQALPLGNGRLGVMVYGIPHREELQLNKETIWPGSPYRNDNPKGGTILRKFRI